MTTTDGTRTADYNTIYALRSTLGDEDSASRNEFDSARASLVQYDAHGRVDWAATRKAEIADLERRLADVRNHKARMKKAKENRLQSGELLHLMQALDHLYAASKAGGAVTEEQIIAVENAVWDAGGWPRRLDVNSLAVQGDRLRIEEVEELDAINNREIRWAEMQRAERRGVDFLG